MSFLHLENRHTGPHFHFAYEVRGDDYEEALFRQ